MTWNSLQQSTPALPNRSAATKRLGTTGLHYVQSDNVNCPGQQSFRMEGTSGCIFFNSMFV